MMIDQNTFETVYTAQVANMIRYVRVSFQNEHLDAETIVADAFTKVWNARENVADQNLAGYVQRTVKTVALDAIRARKIRPEVESIFSDDTSDDQGTYRVELPATSDHNPYVGTLNAVTAILTETQRRVVMMRLDYQFSEIATILATENGITLTDAELVKATDSAKKLYNRARATMRRAFPERVAV